MTEAELSFYDEASTATEVEGHHILVVEDDPSTAEMLTAYFSSLGYDVKHTGWGQDAIDIVSNTSPDLVILDIHLPDIDGYQVCSEIRRHARTQNTPVIFLTERRDRADRLTGLELGAVDYVTKPFDIQELRFRVRNALRRSTREALLHPVTNLPTSLLVEEEIRRAARDPELALIVVTVQGMAAFNEAYGFVTHDDVLRAVALILRNTLAEFDSGGTFVGQLDLYQYVMVMRNGQQAHIAVGRLHQRFNEAVGFFYPHRDLERKQCADGTALPRLEFDIRVVPPKALAEVSSLDDLRRVLQASSSVGDA